ncbi:MAG: dienelactone hydrolase family protein [Burkholderiaceae bacterium]
MGSFIDLQAADGFTFPAYIAQPAGKPRGGLVLLQEIFGVNSHIRDVADRFAAEGFFVVAPATFHRVQQGVDLGYDKAGMDEGSALKAKVEALEPPGVLHDVEACVRHAAQAGKVGITGFCWGGLLTWRAACTISGIAAAVPYYGGGMTTEKEIARKPLCPVLAHFGNRDKHISVESVEAFKKAHPEVEVHLYEADHGFNCDQRGSYDAAAAKLAWGRTNDFLGRHLA